jgi:hypothetical protein
MTIDGDNSESPHVDSKKCISISLHPKNICVVKKIRQQKERKPRVETHTWGLNDEELSRQYQLDVLRVLCNSDTSPIPAQKYGKMMISHIKAKIGCYKRQDVTKHKLDAIEFMDYNTALQLITESELLCYYCACDIYIFYTFVRESKQWSLDRINNDLGHNKNNCVIACLECNLKRRRTNINAFMFTKNMKIIKRD